MNFHWSSPKTDCRNRDFTFQLWENSLYDFKNSIHVARNNYQLTFQFMENQGNTLKSTVFIYFDELLLKLTINKLQKLQLHIQIMRQQSVVFTIASMLPEIIINSLFNLWKIKDAMKSTVFSYFDELLLQLTYNGLLQ